MAELDMFLWNMEQCTGYVHTAAATYPTMDVRNRIYVPFDDTTHESVVFKGICPENYDANTQTIKIDIQFSMASATAGGITFDAFFEAFTPGDILSMDGGVDFDIQNTASETSLPVVAGYLANLTIECDNLDNMTSGDYLRLVIERDVDDASDTATGDVKIHSCRVYGVI